MSSIIDKSLDEIIKEEKKEKRREMLKKKKQQQQQKQGRNIKNQKANTIGRQGNTANGTQKGQGRSKQKQRQARNRGIINNQGRNEKSGNQHRGGKPRVLANKLKNRQPFNNAGKQMLNRLKKAQGKRQQSQKMRQKDARQNILDRKRGIQSSVEGQGSRTNINVTRNRSRQISSHPQHQGQNKRQRNRRQQNTGRANELRVSVANTRPPLQNRVQQPKQRFNINRATFSISRTSTTLNERFSERKVLF